MNYTQFLIENVKKFPNKPCLHYKTNAVWNNYTWNELQKKVAQTVSALRSIGVKPNDNIAIYSENSAEWIIFDLAVVSMGAVSVPIYATNTASQAEYIINDAAIKVILTGDEKQFQNSIKIYSQNEFLEYIIYTQKEIEPVIDKARYFHDWIADFPSEFSLEAREDDAIATLIYTSGTTGNPKGVILTHGNLLSAFEAHISFFNFKAIEQEHSLSFLPLSHIFERTWAMFMLHVGAQIYMSENPKLIAETLKEVKPTMMCSVPRLYQKIHQGIMNKIQNASPLKQKIFHWSLAIGSEVAEIKRKKGKVNGILALKHMLAERLVFSKIRAQMGGRLWFMPVGGAAISAELTRFFDALGIHLTVGYGLTETTATLTCFPLQNYEHGTAGIPLTGVQIKIGEQNEVWAKGRGVMKGYYNKPEETAQVFTPDGWFKTGDSGKINDDGCLVIVDRIKDLMKTSNGKYITPQPIENLLTNDTYIQQAVLIGDDKPYVTALLVPDFEALAAMAAQLNIKFDSIEELLNIQKIKDFYTERVNQLQKNMAGFEKIKNFRLLPTEFNMELDELTPTLKIKRNIVLKKFSLVIDEMYAAI